MKFKILSLCLLGFLISFLTLLDTPTVKGATGKVLEYFVVTSTNTTAISFTNRVEEVYIIRVSTNYCRVNYTGALCANTTTYELIPADASNPVKVKEDIQTTNMSIYTDVLPVNIIIRGKSW